MHISTFSCSFLGDNELVPKVDENILLFQKWNYNWNELIKHRFQCTTTSKKQRKESLGLGLHSSTNKKGMIDDE